MSFFSVQHTGPGNVTKRLDRLAVIDRSNLVMQTIGNILDGTLQQMQKITPVRTGYLRSTEKVMIGDHVAQLVVTARYAWYVDQGRSPRGPRRPQPFWSNSIVNLSVDIIISVRQLYMTVK